VNDAQYKTNIVAEKMTTQNTGDSKARKGRTIDKGLGTKDDPGYSPGWTIGPVRVSRKSKQNTAPESKPEDKPTQNPTAKEKA